MTSRKIVVVTGGAGYIGSRLIPKLVTDGHRVRVLDAVYFSNGLHSYLSHPHLAFIRGDIRDKAMVNTVLSGADAVLHLAAVANDPSFSCDPGVSRSINIDCLPYLMTSAKRMGCRRFIYASSASVYGINSEPSVDELQPCVPITDYNHYKAQGEKLLFDLTESSFETVAVRAATVCGWSPRQRLDLTVNALTMSALARKEIIVFGGDQYRPNIHIDDLARLYELLVQCESLGSICGHPINAGCMNSTVTDIAITVKDVVDRYFGTSIPIKTVTADDVRSYRLDSGLVQQRLGFEFVYTIRDAILEICEKWQSGWFADSSDVLADPLYHNVRNMQCTDWSYTTREQR